MSCTVQAGPANESMDEDTNSNGTTIATHYASACKVLVEKRVDNGKIIQQIDQDNKTPTRSKVLSSNKRSRHEKQQSEIHVPIPLESVEVNNKFIDSPRSIQKR